MISDIVYEQLVNLVNDNIKSEYVDFNNQRIPSVYSCSVNSSLRLSIHPIDLSLKLCKWWVQQNHLSENHL
jgi:hypothetical protein